MIKFLVAALCLLGAGVFGAESPQSAALIHALDSNNSQESLQAAADLRALGRRDIFRRRLRSSDAAIRRRAMEMIKNLDAVELSEDVASLLGDKNLDIRAEALNFLAHFKIPGYRDKAETMLHDKDEALRKAANRYCDAVASPAGTAGSPGGEKFLSVGVPEGSQAVIKDPAKVKERLRALMADYKANMNLDTQLEIVKLVRSMKTKPLKSTEARRQHSIGKKAFAAARTNEEFHESAKPFLLAMVEAPWWTELYRDVGLCCEEAGEYDDAAAAFEFYLKTNPEAADKEKVTEAMELDVKMAGAQKRHRNRAPKRAILPAAPSFELSGRWYRDGMALIDIQKLEDGGYSGHVPEPVIRGELEDVHIFLHDFSVKGRSVSFWLKIQSGENGVLSPGYTIHDIDAELSSDSSQLDGVAETYHSWTGAKVNAEESNPVHLVKH